MTNQDVLCLNTFPHSQHAYSPFPTWDVEVKRFYNAPFYIQCIQRTLLQYLFSEVEKDDLAEDVTGLFIHLLHPPWLFFFLTLNNVGRYFGLCFSPTWALWTGVLRYLKNGWFQDAVDINQYFYSRNGESNLLFWVNQVDWIFLMYLLLHYDFCA